ncbi:MAG TPA: peptide deformylase, partial [Cryptosporangiaceae bacterium]|nr:peptide deformylase [Cryptosporangiaceae bacterium]
RNGAEEETDTASRRTPAERMAEIGIVQEGDEVLYQPARPFTLPDEAEDARRVIAQLGAVIERAEQVHTFAKGIGLAAPQVGISRAAAVVREPDGSFITLLNPRVVGHGSEEDEQYEGCLSFFDVRGMVSRPRCIEVEHQEVDGTLRITEFTDATARLVGHEIDHLEGRLYRARMRPGVEPIPVSQYKGTGEPWRSANA